MLKNTGSRYKEEFKAEAVQLARSSPEESIRQLAYELGIAERALRKWIRQAEIDRGEKSSPPNSVRSVEDSGGKTGFSVRRV